jgi:hypothetical protein
VTGQPQNGQSRTCELEVGSKHKWKRYATGEVEFLAL